MKANLLLGHTIADQMDLTLTYGSHDMGVN